MLTVCRREFWRLCIYSQF